MHPPVNINEVYLGLTLSLGFPAGKGFLQGSGERMNKGLGVV